MLYTAVAAFLCGPSRETATLQTEARVYYDGGGLLQQICIALSAL